MLFTMTAGVAPEINLDVVDTIDDLTRTSDSPMAPLTLKKSESSFSIADSSTSGVLDPLTIEQVGYTPSGTINARTDTDFNTAYSMYLDDDHGWLGSRADIQVNNLKRLYVLNGTFSEGTEAGDTINPNVTTNYYPFGWVANSTSTNIGQVQRVRYEDTGREYVLVENKAKLTNNPQHVYTHYTGTSVYWQQSIDVDSTTTDFLLSFDYLYKFGPINGTGASSFTGSPFVEVIVDGTVIYSISLKDLTQRDYWYSTGAVPISMSIGPGPVDFEIGININGSVNLVLDADEDYDYDNPTEDGASNAEFVTVHFDDVSLIAANAPSFEQVDLQYTVEGYSTPIVGSSGVGSASIPKSDYWISDPVNMQVTSNTTVSFDYNAYLRSHRFSNSTWTTAIAYDGAFYSVNLDQNPQIQFHTYIGFLGDYVNLTTRAWFPSDWENVTVYDPFNTPVTPLCNITGNMAEIPTSLMSYSGWWTFTSESPNYIKSIEIEKLNTASSTWSVETVYRSSNISRAAIEIGTPSETPDPLGTVNVTWTLPNGTEWVRDTMSGGISGSLNSTPHEFGSANTSAGLWSTCVTWSNGSEVAFGATTFEIHHFTTLTPFDNYIETESGQTVTNFVYFTDAENGEYLMDPVVSVSANWSVTTVNFFPEAIQNRWAGIFDTSLVAAGENIVIVTADRPYYDEAACSFIVYSTFSDNDLIIETPPSEVGLGDTFFVTFQYLDRYDAGIAGAEVNINHTGSIGDLIWDTPVDGANGNYSIEFTAKHAGSYAITISASKNLYEAAEDTMFILVGEISTTFTVENGSAAVIRYGEDYQLVVRYVNGTGHGLDSASISLESMTPETGLVATTATPLGNGYFSILLTPQESNTFTILINASLQDHQTKFASFTLTATSIQALLTAQVSDEIISTDQNTVVTLNLTSAVYGALDGATISPYNPPSGLSVSLVTPLGGGLYNITITPLDIGSYQIVFIAYALNHNEATTLVSLEVTPIQTTLRVDGGFSSASVEYSSGFDLLIFFERDDGSMNISSATIDVTFTSFETLEWENISLAEGYIIRFTTDQVGRWEFTVTASRLGHQTEDIQFVIFITEVGTDLSGFSPSEDLGFGGVYTFTFHYYLVGNDTAGIAGATVVATGSGSEWMTYDDLGNGYYNITVTPDGLGHRVVDLTFQITGYQSRTVPFDFTVAATEVQVVMQPPNWYRYHEFNISIQLVEVESRNVVTDAIITFQLIHNQLIELEGYLNETDVAGVYASTVYPQWFEDSGYTLRILIEKENYALVGDHYDVNVVQNVRPDDVVAQFIATVVPPIIGIIGFCVVAIVGQVTRTKRKKAQIAIDMSNRRRFEDADNIIGVIVMHKNSGIPIYSRIVKGGFEEGIVAAFISAVTHFREEFEMFDDEAMKVIPISDIIRAVQTKNLICAFITLRSASMEHNRKMELYGDQVATYLDDFYNESRPESAIDSRIAEILDYIFDETMDGKLIKFYKATSEQQFPKRYRLLEQLLEDIDTRHCSRPVHLAKGVATFGISEARGCTLILEAIDKRLIAQCEDHESTIEEMGFAEFFEKKNGEVEE